MDNIPEDEMVDVVVDMNKTVARSNNLP